MTCSKIFLFTYLKFQGIVLKHMMTQKVKKGKSKELNFILKVVQPHAWIVNQLGNILLMNLAT